MFLAGMCQSRLKAILPSFASAKDRTTRGLDALNAQTKIPPQGWYCLFGGLASIEQIATR